MKQAMTEETQPDPYRTLGLEKDASSQDIKRAFRQIARECHPDVAGSSPEAAERFKRARKAYETLIDPASKARYDRKGTARSNPFEGFWGTVENPDSSFNQKTESGNDLDLEDLFRDFGSFQDLGFGRGARPQPPRPEPESPRPKASKREPGRDVHLKTEIDARTAARGGSVTLTYPRRVHDEAGQELKTIDELYELNIAPGTRHGETLRVPRMGHMGTHGAPPGELVVDVLVNGGASEGASRGEGPTRSSARPAAEPPPHGAEGSIQMPLPLPISISEALLGGRVELETPGGRVRLVIPPGTSSGAVFRIRGKAASAGPEPRSDLFYAARIVVPSALDEQSRKLIEEFCRLNPYDPRSEGL